MGGDIRATWASAKCERLWRTWSRIVQAHLRDTVARGGLRHSHDLDVRPSDEADLPFPDARLQRGNMLTGAVTRRQGEWWTAVISKRGGETTYANGYRFPLGVLDCRGMANGFNAQSIDAA